MFEIRGEHEEYTDLVSATDKYHNKKFIMTECSDNGKDNMYGYVYAICDVEDKAKLAKLYTELNNKGIDCILCGSFSSGFLLGGAFYEFIETDK